MARDPSAHSAASRKGKLVAEANHGLQIGKYRVEPNSTLATATPAERKKIMRWLREQDKESLLYEESLEEEMGTWINPSASWWRRSP